MGLRFRTTSDGAIEIDLEPVERALLNDVIEELASSRADGDDPGYRRLHPPVYLGDNPASDEWWRLMGAQLNDERVEDRRIAAARLGEPLAEMTSVEMTSVEAESLLRVLNEGRLLLAARFGVDVAEDYDDLEEGQRMILGFLSALVDDLTGELSQSLED